MAIARRLLGCALLLLAVSASAGPLVDTIRERQTRIDALLKPFPHDVPPETRQRLQDLLGEAFDFPTMAEAALPPGQTPRSESEREAYLKAFERLVRAMLVRNVDLYRFEKVEFGPEEIAQGRGHVEAKIRLRSGGMTVRYDFVSMPSGWRLADYAVDGTSAVRNFRSQFGRTLERQGWPAFLDALKKRAEKLEASTAR